jgi:hypothetical protein
MRDERQHLHQPGAKPEQERDVHTGNQQHEEARLVQL